MSVNQTLQEHRQRLAEKSKALRERAERLNQQSAAMQQRNERLLTTRIRLLSNVGTEVTASTAT